MKKGAALLEIEDGDETPNPYFGRAASCFQICRDNLCRETINCVGAGLYAFRQDNVTLTKRWRREASQNLTPPAHIIDVRRACDVLTPSGARVNASSNSPVGRALYHILRPLDEEKFLLTRTVTIRLALFLPLTKRTPDPESIKNKEVTHMIFRGSNHNTSMRPEARCVMCGAGINSRGTRSIELLCLICRAAILDRIFQARRQQVRIVGHRG
jgi:hypothetical protein